MVKSFSQRTKAALLTLDVRADCCRAAEICGIMLFGARDRRGELKVTVENELLAKRAAFLLKRVFADTVSDSGEIPEWVFERECCRGAFLRGAFLGSGTIIDPTKGYNMEIFTQSERLLGELMRLVGRMGLDFKTVRRKGSFAAYTKNSEVICDALTHMGAYSAQMEILNVKIEKELHNELNRVANSETANMDKVITAAIRQIQAIRRIEDTIGIDAIPEELREVAIMRKNNKDLSLEELGKKLTPRLSKSGVNHRLKKILDIAENL